MFFGWGVAGCPRRGGSVKTNGVLRKSGSIQAVQKPTLIISHNKTLAAQLYREFKGFFPDNAVEYFVSYYDYYQPEVYVPARDLYIEKDASINDEIDRLRLSATFSLMERRDVIVVSTVSCIYGLGLPESWRDLRITIEKGQTIEPDKLKKPLVSLQYERNDAVLERGRFRVKGDVMEIFPAYMEEAYRVEFDWEEIVRIRRFHPLTMEISQEFEELSIYPAKHFVMPENAIPNAIERIKMELEARLQVLHRQGKLFEAERLKTRTEYDLEMLAEMGHCPGIENYSAPIANRKPGEPPATLFHYFPKDFLESNNVNEFFLKLYYFDYKEMLSKLALRTLPELKTKYCFRTDSISGMLNTITERLKENQFQVIYNDVQYPVEGGTIHYLKAMIPQMCDITDQAPLRLPTKRKIEDVLREIDK